MFEASLVFNSHSSQASEGKAIIYIYTPLTHMKWDEVCALIYSVLTSQKELFFSPMGQLKSVNLSEAYSFPMSGQHSWVGPSKQIAKILLQL